MLNEIGQAVQIAGGLKDLFGKSGLSPRKQMALQYDYQTKWAREELPLRVEGAKAAGLHPLAVLGGGSNFSPSFQIQPDDRGSKLRSLGQDISRAADAYATREERAKQNLFDAEKLKNAQLQNKLLESQITSINRAGATPPFPNGRSMSGDVNFVPDEITSSLKGSGAYTSGSNYAKPAVTVLKNRDGSYSTVPSPDAKNAIEDNILYETEHFFRNKIMPEVISNYESIKNAVRNAWWNPKKYRRR